MSQRPPNSSTAAVHYVPRIGSAPSDSVPERFELVLKVARVLFANGQSTSETLAAARQIGKNLDLEPSIIPTWGELQVQARYDGTEFVSFIAADPIGVNMERVSHAMGMVEGVNAGSIAISSIEGTVDTIAHEPGAPVWLFAVAAAAGAAALSVIFGVHHLAAVALIVLSSAAGAILRRVISQPSANPLLQPLCAALLAGIVGALAVRYQLSSSLRLVAVCPCMILVPGPHVLNAMMDLSAVRVSLGTARLVFAALIILVISIGLLLGLTLLGVSLPVGEPGRAVPLWLDVIAAGVAVASYGVFFSTPPSMLGWPVAVGMVAHALRWLTLAAGAGAATGAFVACLFVGLVLTPVARRFRMPFAAIGFASVVSMMPGVFLFRMASGLLQLVQNSNTTLELIAATLADCMTAVTIILAMSFGIIIPKVAIDWFGDRMAKAS